MYREKEEKRVEKMTEVEIEGNAEGILVFVCHFQRHFPGKF